ncbi:MAG TPA: hypothetical protein VFU80_01280 [Sphingomicrobium sp.]|nr:hypothetical protein [Sphingomicrobium sp.]
MKSLLLVAAAPLAAFALSPASAGAQEFTGRSAPKAHNPFGHWAAETPRIHRGVAFGIDRKRHHDRRGHHRRGSSDTVVISDGFGWYGGEWALYNNRSWESDSYNDWWHDNPSRAYPRWFQNNRNCDRMWAGGGVWRCTW